MNDQHFPSLHYKVPSVEVMREVLNYARTLSHELKIQILDCNKSFARENIDMSYSDIMERLNENCHMVVIHRRGYESWRFAGNQTSPLLSGVWCGEIGFNTTESPAYFLFISISEKDLEKVVKKFGLMML